MRANEQSEASKTGAKSDIPSESVAVVIDIKERYRRKSPLIVPGHEDRFLIPEHLLNEQLDLRGIETPLPLALVAARDPESPMAVAATARLGPRAKGHKLFSAVLEMVGQTSRHQLVRNCVDLITESAFDADALCAINRHAKRFIVQTRRQYTTALRQNLQALLDGAIAPRDFVAEFFQLTEAGNLRHDIRCKLVTSLLLSPTIRPGIKFLFLENFNRLPTAARCHIIREILKAPRSAQLDMLREELRWIVSGEEGVSLTKTVA